RACRPAGSRHDRQPCDRGSAPTDRAGMTGRWRIAARSDCRPPPNRRSHWQNTANSPSPPFRLAGKPHASRFGLILELLDFRLAGQIDRGREEKVGIAHRELPPFARACGVDDGQPLAVPGLWIAIAILDLEEFAVPIELTFTRSNHSCA